MNEKDVYIINKNYKNFIFYFVFYNQNKLLNMLMKQKLL